MADTTSLDDKRQKTECDVHDDQLSQDEAMSHETRECTDKSEHSGSAGQSYTSPSLSNGRSKRKPPKLAPRSKLSSGQPNRPKNTQRPPSLQKDLEPHSDASSFVTGQHESVRSSSHQDKPLEKTHPVNGVDGTVNDQSHAAEGTKLGLAKDSNSKVPQQIIDEVQISRLADISDLKPKHKIKSFSRADFWERPSPLYKIEVLQERSDKTRSTRQASRRFDDDSTELWTPRLRPTRVRIRSTLLLDILSHVTGAPVESIEKPAKTPDKPATNVSMVFLYPFKLFARHREGLRVQRKTWSEQESLPADGRFTLPDALKELDLLLKLFDTELKGFFDLFDFLQNADAEIPAIRKNMDTDETQGEAGGDDFSHRIVFEDLWLLFKPGELIYESETAASQPPRLWRVLQYNGGRQVLNDSGPASQTDFYEGPHKRGSENRFVIRYFGLDADSQFQSFGPVPDALGIPHWDGPRLIQSLKIFPVRFCKSGVQFTEAKRKDWLERLEEEGRSFTRLTHAKIKQYRGMAVDAKDRPRDIDSVVILDVVRARQEVPALFTHEKIRLSLGPLSMELPSKRPPTLFLYRGDEREVYEKPAHKSTKLTRDEDAIHDDDRLEFQEFTNNRDKLRPATFKVLKPDTLHKMDFVLFPRRMVGFVLSSMSFLNLNVQQLQDHSFDKTLWSRVILPHDYKPMLLALCRNHVQHNQPILRMTLDHTSKGQGLLLLLQGHPGTGKSFTVEALANYTDRIVYNVTAGALGTEIADIERNLVNILDRTRLWNCILLLEEADIYLMKRGHQELKRNSIVSIFLRHVEKYPGIIIFTTNRNVDLDPAMEDRLNLALAYQPLNQNATSTLWELCCNDPGQFVADHGHGKPTITISPAVRDWWVEHFVNAYGDGPNHKPDPGAPLEDCPRPWWSGRRIQMSFKAAISLALEQRLNVLKLAARDLFEMAPNQASETTQLLDNGLCEKHTVELRAEHFNSLLQHEGLYQKIKAQLVDEPSDGTQQGPGLPDVECT